MSSRSFSALTAAALVFTAAAPHSATAQQPPPAQAPQAGRAGGAGANARPRPYAQVITERAVTRHGGITVHRVDDRWFFEVPDSLLERDFLLVSRVGGVPSNFSASTTAGNQTGSRAVRFERPDRGDRIVLRSIGYNAVADDTLPIAQSVALNNVGAVLGAFPIQAFTRDSNSYVVDVTDFFAGDTPAITGLSPALRRSYGVRRLDPARSYIDVIRTFPINVEVHHTETFDAADPPSDTASSTLTIQMRQSLLLLPKVPMRPRFADERVGYFTISRINYGLDQLKAPDERLVRRWRLEPKDPAAYARGELVEPVKPIVFYVDPATPTRWRRYVKEGVEQWQKAFEVAGFKNAILAKDPPSKEEDPDWDPEDARYSSIRWAASLVRNAQGPSTSDPRSGEILVSEITWFHNHMRSYRNRLMVETGAANPMARTLDTPDELMGFTMRQVITHEVGHAIGLAHNMIASASFPVDSLRKPSFASVYGVAPTIMDYARQNYVAQPGDGLAPTDFVRRLGPWDKWVINWGYRVFPQARTAAAERPILNNLITKQTGFLPYRFAGEGVSVDPRNQTEDVGDDPMRAGSFAIMNMKKVVPNLIAWTSHTGEDYTDLTELYGEAVGMWDLYMQHVVAEIGGLHVDLKSSEQSGAVFTPVAKAEQQTALRFLDDNVFHTPTWLLPSEILSRTGLVAGNASVLNDQVAVLNAMLDTRRLARLSAAEQSGASDPYTLAAYLDDVRRDLWESPAATAAAPDANRRALERAYIDALGALVSPSSAGPAAAGRGGGAGGAPGGGSPLMALPNVPRSDLPAMARSELRAVRDDARKFVASAPAGVERAHWQDVADRITRILEPPAAH